MLHSLLIVLVLLFQDMLRNSLAREGRRLIEQEFDLQRISEVLALGPRRTCDWTYGLASDICFSRRLSPLRGIRNLNSI